METEYPKLTRRLFACLLPMHPSAWSVSPDTRRKNLFFRDLGRSYEQQRVALDMEDVGSVLNGIRAPVIGFGLAEGEQRTVDAARAAVRDAGGVRRNSLVLVACPPREGRFAEYRQALNTVRSNVGPSCTLIYAASEDATLPKGFARVLLLTG